MCLREFSAKIGVSDPNNPFSLRVNIIFVYGRGKEIK